MIISPALAIEMRHRYEKAVLALVLTASFEESGCENFIANVIV
jgi:hypothetical protein